MKSSPIRAYIRLMRFDKPTGIWLLMWPCWWSAVLAYRGLPWMEMILFLLGAAIMRAAGCIVNDLMDRDIDRLVERTRNRPLASGEVSVGEALVLVFFLLIQAAIIAVLLGKEVFLLSFAWLLPVILYPLMKRITWWPQLFLGLTFNAGALYGWLAITGELSLTALVLYAGCVAWTLGYDTIYAHQDKVDDELVGVKSSARRLGERSKFWVAVFYGFFVLCLLFVALSENLHPVFFLFLSLVLFQFAMQVIQVDINDKSSCMDAFRSNQWTGFLIFLMVVGAVI